jgi:hypothetical protein
MATTCDGRKHIFRSVGRETNAMEQGVNQRGSKAMRKVKRKVMRKVKKKESEKADNNSIDFRLLYMNSCINIWNMGYFTSTFAGGFFWG